MIKMTCNEHDVIEMARKCDRLGQFEYDGWLALFQYLEYLSEDTGEDIELDIIAWCCDFQRFEDVDDYNSQYGTDHETLDDVEELCCMVDDGPAFITHAH